LTRTLLRRSRPVGPVVWGAFPDRQSAHSVAEIGQPVNPKVKNLANIMKLRQRGGEKFVLMLGAGASMSSGVKSTPKLMEELLQQYGADLNGTDPLEDRFDKLWKRTSDPDRRALLQPYLDHPPSVGYGKLAELIDAGYFDLALTFNFDDLVEKALTDIGFSDFKRVIRGETIEDEMQKLVDAAEPRFKLIKLHGSLESSDHFLFDVNEMNEYPPAINALVSRITSRDIVMCGYGFKDVCVIRAFAQRGGYVVCVNPSGVPRELRGFLKDRHSDDLGVESDFDTFFGELYDELLAPAPTTTQEKVPPNPFKFLESYEIGDAETFAGRDDAIDDFKQALAKSPPPRVIIVAGPAKAGKTSLVRAGLMPVLNPDTHTGIYVRCQREFEKSLPRDLWPNDPTAATLSLKDALQRLAGESPTRRVVLFLDQFDRAIEKFDSSTRPGAAAISAFVASELMPTVDNLTIALVVVDQPGLVPALLKPCNDQSVPWAVVQCTAFTRDEVATIVHTLATTSGFEFDQRIIDEMLVSYDKTKSSPAPDQRFTLAHIQTVCHILAATKTVDYETYRHAFDNNLKALHQAINVCDIISFVEDFSWSDAVWFRNMIKVPLKESKERIADFIKTHYDELVPKPNGKRAGGLVDARAAGRAP
jgi:hypothetical protein